MDTIRVLKDKKDRVYACRYGTYSKKDGFKFNSDATKSALSEWDYEKIVTDMLVQKEWKAI